MRCILRLLEIVEEPAEPLDKGLPVGVVREELPAFDPPHDDMLEGTRSVNAGLAGHGRRVPQAEAETNLCFYERPPPFHDSESVTSFVLDPGRRAGRRRRG